MSAARTPWSYALSPSRPGTRLLGCWLALAWVLAGRAAPASAPGGAPSGFEHRIAELKSLVSQLEQSPLPPSVYVESEETRSRLRGDVYSIVEQRFDTVRNALRLPANWCQLLPLQLNVKACTHSVRGQQELLTLYLGRKFYQRPEAAHPLPLIFDVANSSESGLEIELRASRGPLGTRDYALSLTAVPLAEGRTLLHLSYSYDYGLRSRLAVFAYLKTMGRKKVGFTVVGEDCTGRPVYVRGVQGMIERNAMRYHLAVQAYLETLHVPDPERFEQRLQRWFGLTSAYRTQLFEMGREDYLRYKRREREEQTRLQHALSESVRRTVASRKASR